MTSANQPQEPVSEQEMHPIQQLIQEVKNQRNRIMELSNIISSQFNRSTGKRAPSPTGRETVSGASWEVEEMEEIMQELATAELPKSSHAQGPSTSPPRSSTMPMSPPTATQPHRVTRIVGMPISGSQPAAARPSPHQAQIEVEANQVALTKTALESWGQKVVTWGKKNKGQVYVDVYEKDVGYVKWVLAQVGGLHEDIEDFANYAITRRRLHGERGDAECAPMSEWQPIPESRTAMAYHARSPCHVRDVDEAVWLKEMCKLVSKGANKCKQLDPRLPKQVVCMHVGSRRKMETYPQKPASPNCCHALFCTGQNMCGFLQNAVHGVPGAGSIHKVASKAF